MNEQLEDMVFADGVCPPFTQTHRHAREDKGVEKIGKKVALK
jgi:hypothetical protein